MLQLMKNPSSYGVRRNGCVAKPCALLNLPLHNFTMATLVNTVMETCPSEEDSVCGMLMCRKKGRRDQEKELERREANEGVMAKTK